MYQFKRSRLNVVGFLLMMFGLLGAGYSLADEKDTCVSCHEGEAPVVNFLHRPHGQSTDPRTPMGSEGCESCHGASEQHKDKPREFGVDRSFKADSTLTSLEKNDICLGCHKGGNQKSWMISEHASADVACVQCHSVHAAEDPVQQRITQTETCFGCHKDKQLEIKKFSSHPIDEGVVACADCHNTHGGKGPNMLAEATVNETCYQCHTEKRGPLLFEHEPVQDNCANCHTPHGSVNDNLLVTRPPLLCQQCHIASRHPGGNYITENDVASGNVRLIGKGCVNCHAQVHGTNHPAGFTFRR